MAQGVDFLRLYREFNLEPGAGIDDLKQAYRRRVSMVHPDRLSAKDPISQHLATEHLQVLTMLYEAGVQFHRQHGRLPGAMPLPGVERRQVARDDPAPRANKPRSRSGLYLLILAGGFALWAAYALLPGDEPAPAYPPAVVADRQPVGVARSAVSEGLRLGMPQRVVLSEIGEPFSRDEERWSYGPSWIRFRKGRVVEWYSSPLHPLRVSRDGREWMGD
ncbi:MAG TPA: J domain-containing protein [Dokdonella sp.]|nr:J domain-containing protein [Dokdonella sp.]